MISVVCSAILTVIVALGGHTRSIDLVKIIVDDRPPEHFAVMAGVGIDAMIMDETDENLKEKVGSAAYFVAAGNALGRLPRLGTADAWPSYRSADAVSRRFFASA